MLISEIFLTFAPSIDLGYSSECLDEAVLTSTIIWLNKKKMIYTPEDPTFLFIS